MFKRFLLKHKTVNVDGDDKMHFHEAAKCN